MTGGLGSDRFVFGSSWRKDQITDFKIGVDLIDLSGTGLSFGNLTRANSIHRPNFTMDRAIRFRS